MINLLPLDDRKQLHAARTNVLLLRYSIGLVFAAVFAGLTTVAIYAILTNMKLTAEATITSNQSRASNFSTVQTQADEYRKNLTNAQTVFNEEIQFSKLYLEIAHLLPANTALDSLVLDSSTIDSPMELPVKIKGEAQATALIASFKSSAVFNNEASYGTLALNTADDKEKYPYVLTVNVKINKGALK